MQIGAFGLSAVASGCMFTLWWRMGEEGRNDVWRLYGIFTALMCIGSCAGAVAFGANMRYLAGTYAVITDLRLFNDGGGTSTPLFVRILLLAARTDGWLPVFLISNAAGSPCTPAKAHAAASLR